MMKRMIALCMAVLLMLCSLPAAQAQIATATVKGGWLKLRAEPNSNAAVLDSFNTGTLVTILGTAGDWYYVQVPNGKQGYMMTKYLTLNPSADGSSGGSSSGDLNIQAYVTSSNGGSVRLRSGAGTSYSTLGEYKVGTPATILSKSTYWFRVKIDGKTGYMMSQYLTTTKPTGGSTQTGSYTAYVTSSNGGSVRMRNGAGTGYGTLMRLSVGTKVTVLERGDDWSRILYGTTTGYMMTQYLTTTQPSVTPATPSTGYIAYVTSGNGGSVHVRSGAGSDYSSRGSLEVGTVVTVLAQNGDWYYITSAYLTGYMKSEYLTTTPPSTGSTGGSTSTPSSSYTAYVVSANGGSVRLRKGAGTSYGTITELKVGTQVTVLSHGASWDYVRYGTTTGYMMTQFLSKTKPSTGSSVTPPSSDDYTAYIVSDNGGKVNVRTGAGTGYSSKGQLTYGTVVTVLARGTSWTYISSGSLTGYVKNVYLSTTPPTGTGGSSSATMQVTGVTLSNLSPVVGETLRATLTPANASVNYAWVNDQGQVLSSNATYTVKSSDIGSKISLRVAGSGKYTGSAVSGWAVPQETSSGSITLQGIVLANGDDPVVGSIISAAVLPANAAATYAWYRSDGQLVGTSAFYVVKAEDVGMKVYCVATGAGSSQGVVASEMSGTIWSETTDIQLAGQVSLPTAALPGVVLRPSASLNMGEYACVWYVNGSVFSTGGALTVTDDMIGKQIYVVLSAVTGSGYTGSVSSNMCVIVQPSYATMTDLAI